MNGNMVTKKGSILLLAVTVSILPLRVEADEGLTARNKSLVRDFYTTVLIGRDVDAAPRFLRPDYIQHNPQVPTGLKGLRHVTALHAMR